MKSPIRPWVEATFKGPGPRTFIECGAHRGEDTEWLSRIPGVTLHALEPDPRNIKTIEASAVYRRPNVVLWRAAVAAQDGRCSFITSRSHRNPFFQTASGSIRAPKTHFQRFPYVAFGDWIEVECMRLDTLVELEGIGTVDFLWADVQGAERDLIAGGQAALTRTRYLFTEYCPDGEEWYEGQATYSELMALLPGFQVVQKWQHDVLLVNRELAPWT
jgi:FkbM family methyltransferase